MKDLENLRLTVKNADSRDLLDEAIRSYNAGAHRAAIISLWVCVSFDLISKLRSLSDSGNMAAKSKIESLDGYITGSDYKNLQKFERELLDVFKDEIHLISSRDHLEMTRLYEDRHVCAHPAFVSAGGMYSPNAEVVRAHIVSAVQSILSRPPVSGMQLLSVLKNELSGMSWPHDSIESSGKYLNDKFLKNSTPENRQKILKLVIKMAVKPESGDITIARRCRQAFYGVRGDYPGLVEDMLREVFDNWESAHALDDDDLVMVAGAFGGSREFWSEVDETVHARMLACVAQRSPSDLLSNAFFVGTEPLGGLEDVYFEKFHELDSDQVGEVVTNGISVEHLLPYLTKRLGVSSSFRGAEFDLNLLMNLTPQLGPAEIDSLFDAIVENGQIHTVNQVAHAGATEKLLKDIYNSGPKSGETKSAWLRLAKGLDALGNSDENWPTDFSGLIRFIEDSM